MINNKPSAHAIETYLQTRIAADLDLAKSVIPLDANLGNIGLNSVLISFIEGDLEEWLQVEIPPALLLQSSNIKDAAATIAELMQNPIATTQS